MSLYKYTQLENS